jgi:DNA polymerase III subunit gamma/tau
VALDTKYRPQTYSDVLGQEASVQVLKQYLKEGKGFHQSYVFCGQRGSGKTTLGRILARALLCSNLIDGAPCDECSSCRIFLDGGTHECFLELDAATRSTKEDMLKITEDIQYSSFSGKRRIYLFDESHRLSKQALDAILKPMEDSIPGSEDKQLVCIFCTTEPEKMQPTIFSRCAPAFVIRPVSPEGIAERLKSICDVEGIPCEIEALVALAEIAECHIRDALKSLEGVSVSGSVTLEAVSQYLRFNANDYVLDILNSLGNDLPTAVSISSKLSEAVSPTVAYERMAEASLWAYRLSLGVGKVPVYWNKTKIQALSEHGSRLVEIANRFASPPRKPSPQTLVLDVSSLHMAMVGGVSVSAPIPVHIPVIVETVKTQTAVTPLPGIVSADDTKEKKLIEKTTPQSKPAGGVVSVNPKAVGNGSHSRKSVSSNSEVSVSAEVLSPELFRKLVEYHINKS